MRVMTHLTQWLKKNRRNWIFLDLFFITLLAAYIFGFQYLPLQDYPNWLYQGFIFKEYVFDANSFHGYFHLRPYLPPNAISTILIGVLSVVVSPFAAGKVFLFATTLLLYTGAKSYLSYFVGQQKIVISCIAFYLIFNENFLMGFINYGFGFGLALVVMSYFLRKGLQVNRLIAGVFFLLLYLSHFAAFGIVLIFLCILAYHRKEFKPLWSLTLATVPELILFVQYLLMRSGADLNFVTVRTDLHYRLHMIFNLLLTLTMPFHHYNWLVGLGGTLEAANASYCVLLLALIVFVFIHQWRKKCWTLELRLAVLFFLSVIFLPDYLGGVMYPSGRVANFLLLNILVSYLSERAPKLRAAANIMLVVSLVCLSYFHNIRYTSLYNKQVLSEITPMTAILRNTFTWEGTDGFEHFIFYHGILHHEVLSPFRSGLFDYPVNSGGISFENK
jgi:hypothetical protein